MNLILKSQRNAIMCSFALALALFAPLGASAEAPRDMAQPENSGFASFDVHRGDAPMKNLELVSKSRIEILWGDVEIVIISSKCEQGTSGCKI